MGGRGAERAQAVAEVVEAHGRAGGESAIFAGPAGVRLTVVRRAMKNGHCERPSTARAGDFQCPEVTSVCCTQPLAFELSTCTKPFLTSPLATISSLLETVATTLLSRDGAL